MWFHLKTLLKSSIKTAGKLNQRRKSLDVSAPKIFHRRASTPAGGTDVFEDLNRKLEKSKQRDKSPSAAEKAKKKWF